MIKSITAELPVRDVAKTLAYYRDVLGFEVQMIVENNFGAVSSGTGELYFHVESFPPTGIEVYILVDDVDELFQRYKKRGATIIKDLSSRPWGTREFEIEDINRHRLRIGQVERKLRDVEAVVLNPNEEFLRSKVGAAPATVFQDVD